MTSTVNITHEDLFLEDPLTWGGWVGVWEVVRLTRLTDSWGLPCAVVRTLSFHCRGHGSIPSWGSRISHAVAQQKEKKKIKIVLKHIKLIDSCHHSSIPSPVEDFCERIMAESPVTLEVSSKGLRGKARFCLLSFNFQAAGLPGSLHVPQEDWISLFFSGVLCSLLSLDLGIRSFLFLESYLPIPKSSASLRSLLKCHFLQGSFSIPWINSSYWTSIHTLSSIVTLVIILYYLNHLVVQDKDKFFDGLARSSHSTNPFSLFPLCVLSHSIHTILLHMVAWSK